MSQPQSVRLGQIWSHRGGGLEIRITSQRADGRWIAKSRGGQIHQLQSRTLISTYRLTDERSPP